MIIKVDFDYDADYIECPDHMDIETLMVDFNKWIGDPSVNHPFWTDEHHIALYYRADAIVYWLNEVILKENESKAKLLEQMAREEKQFDYAIVL